MKRIFLIFALLVSTNSLFSQLLTEDFSYTAGQLATANGWTAHSAGVNPITVTSPGLSFAGHPGSGVGNAVTMANTGEDINRSFTAVTAGSVYMSFLVNLSAAQTGDYFAGLFQSSSIFPVRVYAKTDGAGGFFLGVSKGSSTATYETTSRVFSTTYMVVVKYTFNAATTTDDVVDLWVNPALGGTETTATIPGVVGTSTDATTIGAVYLRQGSATNAATQQVDAILAGGTWASVTAGSAVPSPTLTLGTISAFGNSTTGTFSTGQTISLSGTNLTGAPGTITITAPNTDFQVSNDNTTWGATATIPFTSATLAATSFYVRFTPQANGPKSGNVTLAGGGANAALAVSGTGVSIAAPVATTATSIGGTGFTANWNAVSGATGYFLDVYTKVPGLITETLAGWNCPIGTVASQTADAGNTNNINIQTVSLQGSSGVISWPSGPSGSSGTPNPFSVSAPGWDNGQDTKYWQVDVNTTGATGITVSSLQGSSSTGPKDFKLQYKVGASGTWADVSGGVVTLTTAVAPANLTTWGALTDVALPSGADNQPLVSLRWIMTSNNAINASPVSSGGTSRISAIYVKGQVNGLVNTYAQQNLSVGNVTSYAVTALTPNTTYYYVVRATNGVSTSVNSNEISVVTNSAPTLSASALSTFGNVCINTASAPNSFTITGSNLSAANVVVGPLAGFAFGTNASGPFQTTLTLTQPGGAYSQQIFVQFSPTTVLSYNGNIPVSGGGAAATQVAASGSGVNTLATVTGGTASAITQTSATVAGSISSIGCSAVTAYGVEYSTTAGFANGAGTAVASSNLSGAAFSAALSGLAPATTYYYHAYATNGGGTAYSTELSFTTTNPNPVLSANTIPGFGNVCINTTTAANSFTITGANLTTANVVVGPLTGYTFSTSSTGTYVATLSITQTGGSFSQAVFVKLTPTAVLSYIGNISVSGGGASTAINVAVTGAGVSTAPSVLTGSASAITTTGATLAGTISATGCTSVTAYGIEYSTTTGFPNGTGTQAAATNLTAGAFSSSLSGLTPGTTYYYKAYATNAGGTTYGNQLSFTTTAPPPAQLSVSALASFGSVCVNGLVGPNSFTITGSNLTSVLITVGPLDGYSFSQTSAGSYNNTIGILQTGGNQSIPVFVKFNPTAAQTYNGLIPVSGGGAPTVYVTAAGTGANTPATVTTGAASSITTRGAVLAGSSTPGCSAVTAYGIEYSSINGFANGNGTKVPSTNLSATAFQASVVGLLQGATYYYKAYATSSAGTAYGAQQSFTLTSIGAGFKLFPSPARAGEVVSLTVSLTDINPGYYGLQFFDVSGRMIHVHNMSIQGNFIDRSIPLPAHWPIGIYEVRLINFEKELGRQRIVVQ